MDTIVDFVMYLHTVGILLGALTFTFLLKGGRVSTVLALSVVGISLAADAISLWCVNLLWGGL